MEDSYLIFRDADGVKYAQVNSYNWLTARLAVNRIDRLKFELPGDHAVLDQLADRHQVEFWRRDPAAGLDWYRHFSGLYRGIKQQRPGATRSVITALGDRSLLQRRIVAWPAGTSNRSAFVSTAAETIMKLLVTWNETSHATTAAGRTADGTPWPAPYITIDVETASVSPIGIHEPKRFGITQRQPVGERV